MYPTNRFSDQQNKDILRWIFNNDLHDFTGISRVGVEHADWLASQGAPGIVVEDFLADMNEVILLVLTEHSQDLAVSELSPAFLEAMKIDRILAMKPGSDHWNVAEARLAEHVKTCPKTKPVDIDEALTQVIPDEIFYMLERAGIPLENVQIVQLPPELF